MLKQKDAVEEFVKGTSKFVDLIITDSKLTVTPLTSIEEFMQEGNIMNHCVFTTGYWKRAECLILSVHIGEKHIETVEVNLKT